MTIFGLPIELRDVIDILLVTTLLYGTYRLLKNYGAATVFHGIVLFFMTWFLVVVVFRLKLMGSILNNVLSIGALALVIIFQEEIRMFFSRLGNRSSKRWLQRFSKILSREKDSEDNRDATLVLPIVMACKNMAKSKTGALIVVKRNDSLDTYVQSGERLEAKPSARLLENIFWKNTPLHDGAVIITGHQITAAACVLPVSRNMKIPQQFGLRHRAALGISEKTDAIAIVVSEETGKIAVAIQGNIQEDIAPQQLEQMLTDNLRTLQDNK
ncbi:MAG: diadenylate cyclase CdaA [Paludibacteraceae bacterium]|nr:diadenylate cyclase CdaA [Paludibacteraceae bacterium]